MTLSSPIGIFDSGIGGLSVARAVRERLPGEDILYVADSRHAPYGDKSDAFIRDRMHMITDFLLARGAKAVVVACNTATTAAIAELREAFSVPIIGVEPGVKPAVEATRTGVVGVLATPRTLQTHSFEKLAARFSTDVTLLVQPCPQLVRQIEALDFDGDETRALLREYLAPLLSEGADTIVLGCTHYNYLAEQIAAVAGRDITIISTEDAV
ncbi:MAG: glutamate racemase, partial [Alcanivorax nanhaiticus]